VTSRFPVWLAALLLFNGVFNVSVTRAATNGVSICAVYSVRKKLRAEQKAEAAPAARRPEPAHFVAGPPRDRAVSAAVDFRLFQRPPPTFSF
jgi:hypothetical protein